MTARIVVLVSGSGSNLQALLDAGDLGGKVVRVIADRHGAGGLDRAHAAGVDALAVARADHADRESWEAALVQTIADAEPDLLVLAGFMRILSAAVVDRWPTMNVHPSLLPAFPGAHAVEEALAWGVKVVGCTVHFVDEQVDHGPIISQHPVPVTGADDAASLHGRIQAHEHRLLPEAVRAFCTGQIHITDRTVRILPPTPPARGPHHP